MPLTIGIVEDEKHMQSLIAFKLRNAGYNVELYDDGHAEAEKRLLTTHHDAILLDLMIPGTHGYELLVKLRTNKETKDTPIIVITALTLEKDLVKAFSLGATDFIKKPFSPSELVARLKARVEEQKPKQSNESNTSKEITQESQNHNPWFSSDIL